MPSMYQALIQERAGLMAQGDTLIATAEAANRGDLTAEAKDKLDKERAEFESRKNEHDTNARSIQAKVMADLAAHKEAVKKFQAEKQEHERAVDLHTQAVAAAKIEHLRKDNELAARENRLNAMSKALQERQEQVAAAESDLTQRINKMRALAAG